MKTTPSRAKSTLFPTPEDAQNAFYEAFERCDLAAMMAVWAEADHVVCVHPQGPRLVGHDAVRDSWAQIFAGAAPVRVKITEVRRFDGPTVAVHSLIETIGPQSGRGTTGSVHATNVYELTDDGWRMVLHHASTIVEPAPPEEPPPSHHTLH